MVDNKGHGPISTGDRKSLSHEDKCFKSGGDYMKEWWGGSLVKSELFLFESITKNPKICAP
jgi:hypothetical protein